MARIVFPDVRVQFAAVPEHYVADPGGIERESQQLRRDREGQRREHVLPAFSAARDAWIDRGQRDCFKQEDPDGQERDRARTRLEHVEGSPLPVVGRRRDNQGRQCRAAQSGENRRRDDQVAGHEDQEGWLAEELQAADLLGHRCGLQDARRGHPVRLKDADAALHGCLAFRVGESHLEDVR